MSASAREIAEAIKDGSRYAALDFDSFFAGRSGWWHRPFTQEELDEHPDGERIQATVEAALRDIVDQVCALVAYDLEDDGEAAPSAEGAQ
jgi:hypothetical protein